MLTVVILTLKKDFELEFIDFDAFDNKIDTNPLGGRTEENHIHTITTPPPPLPLPFHNESGNFVNQANNDEPKFSYQQQKQKSPSLLKSDNNLAFTFSNFKETDFFVDTPNPSSQFSGSNHHVNNDPNSCTIFLLKSQIIKLTNFFFFFFFFGS